ncbi:hypothetical protein HKBW3S47_02016, partial [Candidatus Hakubella thermalkaliphila]
TVELAESVVLAVESQRYFDSLSHRLAVEQVSEAM